MAGFDRRRRDLAGKIILKMSRARDRWMRTGPGRNSFGGTFLYPLRVGAMPTLHAVTEHGNGQQRENHKDPDDFDNNLHLILLADGG